MATFDACCRKYVQSLGFRPDEVTYMHECARSNFAELLDGLDGVEGRGDVRKLLARRQQHSDRGRRATIDNDRLDRIYRNILRTRETRASLRRYESVALWSADYDVPFEKLQHVTQTEWDVSLRHNVYVLVEHLIREGVTPRPGATHPVDALRELARERGQPDHGGTKLRYACARWFLERDRAEHLDVSVDDIKAFFEQRRVAWNPDFLDDATFDPSCGAVAQHPLNHDEISGEAYHYTGHEHREALKDADSGVSYSLRLHDEFRRLCHQLTLVRYRNGVFDRAFDLRCVLGGGGSVGGGDDDNNNYEERVATRSAVHDRNLVVDCVAWLATRASGIVEKSTDVHDESSSDDDDDDA